MENNKSNYLFDFNSELANYSLLAINGKVDENVFLSELNVKQKEEYINSLLHKLVYYLNEHKTINLIKQEYDISFSEVVGRLYRWYCILTNDTFVYEKGWSKEHGKVFMFFENDMDSTVYASYYSDAHKEKEFREVYNFGITKDDKFSDFIQLKTDELEAVTPIEDYIHTFFSKRNDDE